MSVICTKQCHKNKIIVLVGVFNNLKLILYTSGVMKSDTCMGNGEKCVFTMRKRCSMDDNSFSGTVAAPCVPGRVVSTAKGESCIDVPADRTGRWLSERGPPPAHGLVGSGRGGGGGGRWAGGGGGEFSIQHWVLTFRSQDGGRGQSSWYVLTSDQCRSLRLLRQINLPNLAVQYYESIHYE